MLNKIDLIVKSQIFFVVLLLSACSFRPSMPEVETQVEMNYSIQSYNNINEKWWEEFHNDELNELVEKSLQANSDLLLALNALEQARINLRLANIEFLPNVNLQGDISRAKSSLNATGKEAFSNSKNLSAVASWELDLWGRVRNSIRANEASFQASIYDLANARLSLSSNVANSYFTLLSLQEQELVLKESLASYEETLAYRKIELESGAITELVYYQALSSVDSAKTQLAVLQDSLIKARTALAILTGQDAKFILENTIQASTNSIEIPSVPQGVAADILERRADIAAALQRLKAANAAIGVARANYFPKISLTGLFGFSSSEFNDFFSSTSQTWNVAGSVVMPLLDFGRTYNQTQLAWLDQNASMINYDKTLKSALGEVRDALDLRENASYKLEAAQNLYDTQKRVFELSKARYDAGYSSHLEFLDAQRNFLSARLEFVNAKVGIANSVVEVFKALGGGFKTQTALSDEIE